MRRFWLVFGFLFATGAVCASALNSYAQADTAKYHPFGFEEDADAPSDTAKHHPFGFEEDATDTHGSTKRALSYAVRLNPGTVLALDQYVKTWLKDRRTFSLSAEVSLDTRRKHKRDLPATLCQGEGSDGLGAYAADYGYPTFSLGLRYSFNHGTTMHRDAKDWGEKLEVPYTTRLGDVLTLYGRFDRPLFRTRRWSGGYSLGTGVGVAMSHYDTQRHIDNELIGTRLNIYFTAGLFVNYRLSRTTLVEGGLDFSHHSNGALYRPNKGANYLGPFIGVRLSPEKEERGERKGERADWSKEREPLGNSGDGRVGESRSPGARLAADDWRKHPWQLELSLGVGAKTLNEQWQQTQFYSQPTDADYRTADFAVYGAFSLQADVLCRYARRWASGLGLDLFYGDYASRAARYEANAADHVSPWSVGVALKHEAHYGRLTARMGLGVYLFRSMGTLAKAVETPYYERVGLFYTLDRRSGLAAGFSVNAHKTKADFTELSLSIPIRL